MDNISGSATEFLASKIKPLKINQITHYSSCERYLKRHRIVGVVLVVASTISLATTFLDEENLYIIKFVIPLLSIIVAALSALLTFAGDQARAMDHQASAIAYGALLRQCEVRVSGAFTEDENADFLSTFLKEWATISSTSPLTNNQDRCKIEKILLSKKDKSGSLK